jgi:hypothetical protein
LELYLIGEKMNITVEELQNEIGRLHIQIMAYEKERVRLEAELAKYLPAPQTPPATTKVE